MQLFDVTCALIFPFIFPMMLHLGLLRGDDFYPRRVTGNPKIDGWLKKYILIIIFLNSVLLCAAAALWKLLDSHFWFIPLLIGVPFFVTQLFFIGATKVNSALESKRSSRS
jgi:hypothetical protein